MSLIQAGVHLGAEAVVNDLLFSFRFGELFIHVVVKKELFNTGPQRLRFRKFLKEYQYEDWYLSNTIPQEMMPDLTVSTLIDWVEFNAS